MLPERLEAFRGELVKRALKINGLNISLNTVASTTLEVPSMRCINILVAKLELFFWHDRTRVMSKDFCDRVVLSLCDVSWRRSLALTLTLSKKKMHPA